MDVLAIRETALFVSGAWMSGNRRADIIFFFQMLSVFAFSQYVAKINLTYI